MSAATVRMVREYEGSSGSVWRDYKNERGQVVCIRARKPGGKRKLPQSVTARQAAAKFGGKS